MPKTELTDNEIKQLANNYANAIEAASGGTERPIVDRLKDYTYYISQQKDTLKKYKVALVSVVLNEPYWQYAKDMVEGARTFFLPGHDVDIFLWSDMPELRGATIFPTEPVEWPLPTLMRYHLYLQQEEKLKEYDYIFHCDVDMRFVDYIGDEVLGEGITAALHPMYDLKPMFYAPFEPNPESAAYIPQQKNYYAGGFQGGKTEDWIKAMWTMRRMVDQDFSINYVPRWNEESIFNRYLLDNPPAVVLSPSYVYPDSLIEEYYKKIWPKAYKPKLVTLTKRFTTSAEAGEATRKMLEGL